MAPCSLECVALRPQEETPRGAASAALCSDLLLALVDCADWLLLFHPSGK